MSIPLSSSSERGWCYTAPLQGLRGHETCGTVAALLERFGPTQQGAVRGWRRLGRGVTGRWMPTGAAGGHPCRCYGTHGGGRARAGVPPSWEPSLKMKKAEDGASDGAKWNDSVRSIWAEGVIPHVNRIFTIWYDIVPHISNQTPLKTGLVSFHTTSPTQLNTYEIGDMKWRGTPFQFHISSHQLSSCLLFFMKLLPT